MIAFDIGEGFLAMVVIGFAFIAVVDRVGNIRPVAITAAWMGAIAAAIGAAVALGALVVAAYAIWSGLNGTYGPGVAHPLPLHSAMVALGVALGGAAIGLAAFARRGPRKNPE